MFIHQKPGIKTCIRAITPILNKRGNVRLERFTSQLTRDDGEASETLYKLCHQDGTVIIWLSDYLIKFTEEKLCSGINSNFDCNWTLNMFRVGGKYQIQPRTCPQPRAHHVSLINFVFNISVVLSSGLHSPTTGLPLNIWHVFTWIPHI